MDFGAIIGFIAIAIISSLFNKDKKAAKPNTRKTFKGGLEDLFKEIKTDFNNTFGDNESIEQRHTSYNSDKSKKDTSYEYNMQNNLPSSKRNDSNVDKDSVYAGEIGKGEISIEFNRKSIVQAVIMSEVLQKPKSLRR